MNDPRIAHTKYNDYKGGAAADLAGQKSLNDLARILKIPKDFWPVGFDFYVGETGLSIEHPEVDVSIYAVDYNEYGSGIDAINKSILSKNGALLVTRFSEKIPVQELFNFFKRFHVTGFNKELRAEKVEIVQQ